MLLLLYLALSLITVIKRRGECEEAEYMLRNIYLRRYNFILSLNNYIKKEDMQRVIDLRQEAIKEKDINKIAKINNRIATALENVNLSLEDKREAESLEENIDKTKNNYNHCVVAFNKSVFNIRNIIVAKICNVHRLEEIS